MLLVNGQAYKGLWGWLYDRFFSVPPEEQSRIDKIVEAERNYQRDTSRVDLKNKVDEEVRNYGGKIFRI